MDSLVVEIGNSSVRAAQLAGAQLGLVTLDASGTRSRPAVVTVRANGTVVPGAEPGGTIVDDVARRLREGTTTPSAAGPIAPETLAVSMLRSVVDAASNARRPATVRLVHGGSWRPRGIAALRSAGSGLGASVTTVAEPVGATVWALASGVASSDEPILVVSAGTETIDAAVTIAGFGRPEVLGRAASIDVRHTPLDARAALFRLVVERIGLHPYDDEVVAADEALRACCREALDRLSTGQETAIVLPEPFSGEVLVAPEILGARMAGAAPAAFRQLRDAVESAHLSVSDVSTVVLTGSGAHSASMVAAISEALHRPVAVPPHPEAAGVLGAALEPVTSPRSRQSIARRAVDDTPGTAGEESLTTAPIVGRSRRVLTAAAVVAVVAALLATLVLARSSGETPAVAEQGRIERTAGVAS